METKVSLNKKLLDACPAVVEGQCFGGATDSGDIHMMNGRIKVKIIYKDKMRVDLLYKLLLAGQNMSSTIVPVIVYDHHVQQARQRNAKMTALNSSHKKKAMLQALSSGHPMKNLLSHSKRQ